MPLFGGQLLEAFNAPVTTAQVAAGTAGTLGGFLKQIPVGATQNLNLTTLAAAADGAKASATTLGVKPLTLPSINVNGSDQIGPVGDGVKTGAFYVSGDNGTTPRALADMVAGDTIYVNPSVLKYNLAAGWKLQVTFQA